MFLILSEGLHLEENQSRFPKKYTFDVVGQHASKNKSRFERLNKIGLEYEDMLLGQWDGFFSFFSFLFFFFFVCKFW